MIVTSDETVAPLASALVRAGRAGSGRRIALPNGTASGSVTPLMDRRAFIRTSAGGPLAAPLADEAQEAATVPRIGYLTVDLAANPHLREAFVQGLRDLGYVEGRTVAIEDRSAEGRPERVPTLPAELVALQVDVIVTSGTLQALAAQQEPGRHRIGTEDKKAWRRIAAFDSKSACFTDASAKAEALAYGVDKERKIEVQRLGLGGVI